MRRRSLSASVSEIGGNAPADALDERTLVRRAFARLDPVGLALAVGAISGAALFVATAVLLVRGGVQVGFHLGRLAYFLPGYSVSWPGAFVGLVEGGLLGCMLGLALALAWNLYHRWFVVLWTARETRRELEEL